MKIKKNPKGILGYIAMWFSMIILVVLMPVLHLFKYSVVVKAEKNRRI